jgi:hypothetical protein
MAFKLCFHTILLWPLCTLEVYSSFGLHLKTSSSHISNDFYLMGDMKTHTHLKVGQCINDKNSHKQTHIWLKITYMCKVFLSHGLHTKRKSSSITKTSPYFDHLPSPQPCQKLPSSAHGPSYMSWIHFIKKSLCSNLRLAIELWHLQGFWFLLEDYFEEYIFAQWNIWISIILLLP